jgi:hypothetical protein
MTITREQAAYDMKHLPMRQATLKAMHREPWQTWEGKQIIEREHFANRRRIAAAADFLQNFEQARPDAE